MTYTRLDAARDRLKAMADGASLGIFEADKVVVRQDDLEVALAALADAESTLDAIRDRIHDHESWEDLTSYVDAVRHVCALVAPKS